MWPQGIMVDPIYKEIQGFEQDQTEDKEGDIHDDDGIIGQWQ